MRPRTQTRDASFVRVRPKNGRLFEGYVIRLLAAPFARLEKNSP